MVSPTRLCWRYHSLSLRQRFAVLMEGQCSRQCILIQGTMSDHSRNDVSLVEKTCLVLSRVLNTSIRLSTLRKPVTPMISILQHSTYIPLFGITGLVQDCGISVHMHWRYLRFELSHEYENRKKLVELICIQQGFGPDEYVHYGFVGNLVFVHEAFTIFLWHLPCVNVSMDYNLASWCEFSLRIPGSHRLYIILSLWY